MADEGGDSTIRQVFIKMGWKVDESSRAAADAAMVKSTALGVALGATLFEAGKQAFNFFDNMAQGYEKLYFASKRTGATAAEITDLSLSLQNAGVSAAETHATLEKLAAFQRNTPAAGALLQSLGVKQGDLGDNSKVFTEVIDWARKQLASGVPYWSVEQQVETRTGGAIGDNVLVNALNAKPDTTAEDFQKKFGVSMDDATKASHDFEQGLRDTTTLLELELLPALKVFSDVALGAAKVFSDLVGGKSGDSMSAGLQALGVPKGAADFLSSTPDQIGSEIAGADLLKTSNSDFASNPKTAQAVAYFQAHGWTKEQAIGLTSNLIDESGLSETANGDKGTAWGIGQWHQDRVNEILKGTGIDVRKAGYADQLKAVNWELKNTEELAGGYLSDTNDPAAAAFAASRYYERPAGGVVTASQRAMRAEGLSHAMSIGNINVTVQAQPGSDAKTQGNMAGDAINSTIRNQRGASAAY